MSLEPLPLPLPLAPAPAPEQSPERPGAGVVLVASAAATLLLYNVPLFGRILARPLILLSTLAHEMGHGRQTRAPPAAAAGERSPDPVGRRQAGRRGRNARRTVADHGRGSFVSAGGTPV